MSKVAVVVPIYKEKLDDLEKISLTQVRKVLKNYPIIFVAPEGKNFSYLEPGEMLVQFHSQYFQSCITYSQLLLQPFFYEPFLVFDYILIYQLDAFVFYDALEDFCRLGYDYIGAPLSYHAWQGIHYPKTPRVGNGGFCLRKVAACHKLLRELELLPNWQDITEEIVEDGIFSVCGVSNEKIFNVAPIEVAELFSMEYRSDRHVKRLGYKLPFGCHGWTKNNADFYIELFARFGYDLSPFKNQMRRENYESFLSYSLEMLAMKRLIRRVNQRQSLLKYLPTKNFASVRVIKSSDTMKILAQLLTEENFITDKIFIYDEKDFRDLIRDVSRENLPHLVVVADYDRSLVAAIENNGLVYGKHVISFRQEYLRRCVHKRKVV